MGEDNYSDHQEEPNINREVLSQKDGYLEPVLNSLGKKSDGNSEDLLHRTFSINPDKGIELLFQWYYHPLCSHAVRYVSSKEIAEDIVSDVFYTFHSDRLFLKIETSYRAYLFTVVRHKAFDYVRNEMKRSTSLGQADYIPIREDLQPDSITQFEDLYHDVVKAIGTLPVKRRKVYIMHRFEGKKFQEIASEMDLSLRTVETHMYQAVHQVRQFLREKWLVLLLSLLHTT